MRAAAAGLTRESRGDLCARRRASGNRGGRIRVTSGDRPGAESGPDRFATRARRGTRDHAGADARGRQRAGGPDADLRGR